MIGAIQVSEDVTERMRLEAVRQTAITVIYEINNPLTTILDAAQVLLLSQKEELSDRTREWLKMIEAEVKRIPEVTKRLRSLDELKTDDYIDDGPKIADLGLNE